MSFLVRRVLASLVQLVLLSIAISGLFRLAPGDFYTADLTDPQRPAALHGVHESWGRQYVEWVASSLHGDFGTSLAYGAPVGRLIGARVARTLEVALPGLFLAWILGVAGAVFSLRFRMATMLDPGAAATAMVPDVVTVSLLLWLAVWAGVSITGQWLPVLGLTCAIAPMVFLHASGALHEARELEFVRIAETRNLRAARLWKRYILRAAANPLISLAGLSIASAVGSSFVVEVLTGWPGLGPLFLEAVQARDVPIVQTVLMLLAAVLTAGNLVADLLLYRLDPRIRIEA